MRIGVLPFTLGCGFSELVDSWRAAEEAGFDSLWTIDHATPAPDLRPAWEASSLLVAMAARTQAIHVGAMVFEVGLRHPFILAGSIAVAQAVSGGRVRVGLGVGDKFSKVDHDALGLPFPEFAERARALERCCTVLPALWRGETVTEPLLGLTNAGLGPLEIEPPPIIVAGGNRHLIEVAVRHADGWNFFTQLPEEFAARARVVTEVETSTTRQAPLQRSVYLFVDRIVGDLRDTLDDFARVGADEAVLVVASPKREAILRVAQQLS